MAKLHFPAWTVPFALLAACLIGFGLLIPWLGFYWDDWPTIWFLHFGGPSSFKEVFAVDRPLLSWLFGITTQLVGESTVGWQVFGVLTRWLCSLALWWTLKSLWPNHLRVVTWTAILFAVYPGFRQHYISVTYSHDWIILSLFLISYGTMIWAVRQSRWSWPLMLISWLLSAYAMFADEYYFGLELLRPVVLWITLAESLPNKKQRFLRSLLFWLPYLAIMGLFLVWRLILFKSPRGDVQVIDQLTSNPVTAILTLGRSILEDVAQGGIYAWAETFNVPKMLGLGNATSILYLVVVLTSFFLVFLYLWKFDAKSQLAETTDFSASERKWAIQAIILGGLALLVSGIPFWATGYPIELYFPWDRFTLPMILGSSLLLTGLVEFFIRPYPAQAAILALLVSFAIGFHIHNGTLYRREWASQKAFFWQLAWRAPGLLPQTTVMTADLPFIYFSDNSLTAPLNWLYAPDSSVSQLSYLFYNIESRQDKKLTNFKKDLPITTSYRTATFNGSTSQAVALFYEPPGCVKVTDPRTDNTLPQKPRYFSEVLPLSDPGRIITDANPPAHPPEEIFGTEPEHGWCYYYEKADLASQTGDWQMVVNLAQPAFDLNIRLYEVNAPELIPFIEGYAHLGEWDQAVEKTIQAYNLTPRIERMLCATWKRLLNTTEESVTRKTAFDQVREKIKCTLP